MSKDSMMDNQKLVASHRASAKETCLPSHKSITSSDQAQNSDLTKAVNPGTAQGVTNADKNQQLLSSLTSLDISSHKKTNTPIEKNEVQAKVREKSNFKDPYASFGKEEKKTWLGGLASKIKAKFNGAIETVQNIRSVVSENVGSVLSTVKAKAINLTKSAVVLAKKIIPQPLRDGLVKLKNKVTGFIKATSNSLREIKNGITDFIKSPFKTIASAITGFISGAMRFASKALAMVGIGRKDQFLANAMAREAAAAQAKEEASRNSVVNAGLQIAELEAAEEKRKNPTTYTFNERDRTLYSLPKDPKDDQSIKDYLAQREEDQKNVAKYHEALHKARTLKS